jgi:glutathione S-transferase
VIQVHVVPGAFGTLSLSPFCTKLMVWFKLADLPHEIVLASMMRSPKGKVPFIEENGVLMGDSQLCIEHLTAKYGVAIDVGLSPADLALGRAVRRMIEEGTYWTSVYNRWEMDQGYLAVRPAFMAFMPPVLGHFIVPSLRRKIRKALHAQGTGRHAEIEVQTMGVADLNAVRDLMGDHRFFFGDEPRSIDATIFAFVDGLARFPVDSPLNQAARTPHWERYRAEVAARIGAPAPGAS